MWWFVILFPLFSIAQDLPRVLSVKQGESIRIQVSPAEKLIVPKSGKVAVTALGKYINIRGRALGMARISVGGKSLDINVLTPSQFEEFQKLRDLVAEFKGLRIGLSAPDVTVTGELLRASDWNDIIDLQIKNLKLNFRARIHPQATSETKSMLKNYFAQMHLPAGDINLSAEPSVYFTKEASNISELIAPTGLQVEINPTAISTAPMVRTQIVVASIKRSFSQSLGVKWPTSYKAQVLPELNYSSNSDENSLQLNLLEKKGWGKILASPTLLCRSGKDSSFLAGGEFPIRLVGFKQRDVVWKSYGVLLKVKPLADYNGKMSINIESEVSAIDMSNAVDGIPAVTTNRINSYFDLSKSRTIALSGLITEEKGQDRDGLPFLARVPILGAFFSSQDYKNNKSELVIFVTPKVVLPNDEEPQESVMPKEWDNESL